MKKPDTDTGVTIEEGIKGIKGVKEI